MELYRSSENGFLEELLSLRSDSMEAMLPSMAMNGACFFNNGWNNHESAFSESAFSEHAFSNTFQDYCSPSSLLIDQHDQSIINSTFGEYLSSFGAVDDQLSLVDDEDRRLLANGIHHHSMDMQQVINNNNPCKVEPMLPMTSSSVDVMSTSFDMGASPDNKKNNNNNKVKKIIGQPSKNLMAERRRRKRLNDRLLMLRSVVPKISKMDRTSILGDTIDYMKELLERINNLQEEIDQEGSNQHLSSISIFKDVKPNEVQVRNSPKFDVERRNKDTRIEICCTGKPGLLLSTVTTLEALGLEIQQCVISCFNDFSMQASCSEDEEQKAAMSSEDIKQALFRNAGYGGRCL